MSVSPPRRDGVCPRCGKTYTYTTVAGHKPFPFCSTRCREIDLGKWLTGQYVIPGPAVEETYDEPPPVVEDKE